MRYFFDVDDGVSHHRDAHGSELADLAEARELAAALVVDVARDAMPDGSHRQYAVTVRNDIGVVVHRVEMVIRTTDPSHP